MEAQIKHLRDPSTYSEPIEIDDTSSSDDDTDLEVVPDELPPSEQLHDAEDDDPKFSDKKGADDATRLSEDLSEESRREKATRKH